MAQADRVAHPGGGALPAAAVSHRAGALPDVFLHPEAGAGMGHSDLSHRQCGNALRLRDRASRHLRVFRWCTLPCACRGSGSSTRPSQPSSLPRSSGWARDTRRKSTRSTRDGALVSPRLAPVERARPIGPSRGVLPRRWLEVIFGYVFFAWILLVPHYPYPDVWSRRMVSGIRLPYKLAHAWWPFYWWVVVINVFELAWKTVDFARRGAWQKRKIVAHLGDAYSIADSTGHSARCSWSKRCFSLKDRGTPTKRRHWHRRTRELHHGPDHRARSGRAAALVDGGKMGVEAYRKRVAA